MEMKQLQSFAAVVKYESFTKAAEKLYLSQPTISAHIRSLEEELGKRLILRTTKSVEITPKGREVYEYAVDILDLRERMIASCKSDERKIIHLGASTIPSSYILPEILSEFGKSFPDTYFVIHQSNSQNVMAGVRDGLFNIGLIGMNTESKDLVSIPFCSDRIVVITPVTPHFLELQKHSATPIMELLKEPIILREQGSGSNKSATDYLESIGVSESSLHVTARINDQEAIKNLVAGGVGISLISERAARNFVQERRLLMFELPDSKSRTFYITYRQNYILDRHVRDFISFIREYFL